MPCLSFSVTLITTGEFINTEGFSDSINTQTEARESKNQLTWKAAFNYALFY